ncbi:MAG TPA: DUF1003 domain-containing protein [Longimicrobium sp.]|nr:DUF1003 domain-containing protein [Longimicrobium sp.]
MSTQAESPGTRVRSELDHLAERERRIVDAILRRTHVTRDINQTYLDERTFGERLADRIASFGGSWTFILLFMVFLVGWMMLNSAVLGSGRQFDPFPYILLNLLLSSLAALQAPVIMMSQNRQADRDRMNAANDYDVNLKAELEIRGLHEKLDLLRDQAWADLVRMQQQQIEMLERLVAERNDPRGNPAAPA